MSIRGIIIAVCSSVLLMGCVSAKEHRARLADISRLEADVADLQKRTNALESEKKKLEDDLAALKADYLETSQALTAAKNEIEKLREALTGKEMKIKQHEENLRLKDLKISELEAEIDALSLEKARILEEKEKELISLKKTHEDLLEELHDEIVQGEIEITRLKNKLSVKMVDRILFGSGSAEVKSAGRKVLARVAEILKKVEDRQIRVEGHTDNVPISSRLRKKFPSNWELSTARATHVVRYLQEKGGIDPTLLSAAGYAQYRPVASNKTAEGRAKNRRIEIVLIPLDLDRITMDE